MGTPTPAVRELPDGSLQAPAGIVYRRTPARIKRREAAELVAGGAPIVTSMYPEGLTLYEGADAHVMWTRIKPGLIEGKRPPVRDLQWIGHLWESDEGAPMLFFDGEH